jgi:cob(I)alamin adenosyltransferase
MNEADWQTGYVHVYTGDGKGKTTAALGLAIRAAGAGFNVFIGQFVKGLHYSEMESLHRLESRITLKQFGLGCFILRKPTVDDIRAAKEGLGVIRQVFQENNHRLIILDEANVAVQCDLFPVEELLSLVDAKPRNVELVITGRSARKEVIERADLVTEMCEVKHYYRNGIQARIGIEK